uniref:ATP synthase subunit 8 n=1 Tax=Euciroa cf. queenslandica STW-2017 TaxID=1969321 RepID=A0A1U9XPF0_9BIVA|nr:ATP synthase F0 subunit 8 [Euciroa cf. queenslandica STW-2017]AQZ26130.1 ATP synthase subunit 8 [Euciroa cf. queenslandica STW-2017]
MPQLSDMNWILIFITVSTTLVLTMVMLYWFDRRIVMRKICRPTVPSINKFLK